MFTSQLSPVPNYTAWLQRQWTAWSIGAEPVCQLATGLAVLKLVRQLYLLAYQFDSKTVDMIGVPVLGANLYTAG